MPENISDSVFDQSPLAKFSIYTSVQASIILKLGDEILAAFKKGQTGWDYNGTYGQFWLWVLGAYELVRTMADYSDHFVPELSEQILRMKTKLAVVRVPFAKQELRGKKKERPIYAELSICGIGPNQDTLIFQIEGTTVSASELISEMKEFMGGISKEMIVATLPQSIARVKFK